MIYLSQSTTSYFTYHQILSSAWRNSRIGANSFRDRACFVVFYFKRKPSRQNLVVSKAVCFHWQSACLVWESGTWCSEVRPEGALSKLRESKGGDGLVSFTEPSDAWCLPTQLDLVTSVKCARVFSCVTGRAWGWGGERGYTAALGLEAALELFQSGEWSRSTPLPRTPHAFSSHVLHLLSSTFHSLQQIFVQPMKLNRGLKVFPLNPNPKIFSIAVVIVKIEWHDPNSAFGAWSIGSA